MNLNYCVNMLPLREPEIQIGRISQHEAVKLFGIQNTL